MLIYPLNSPIILNDAVFVEYGGKTGTFTASQRSASYMVAEMQVTSYIGTPLLPVVITGTFPYMGQQRIPTDYGYVSQLLAVNVLSQSAFSTTCDLVTNSGCGFIYNDTYGYIDVKQVLNSCNLGNVGYFAFPYPVFPPTFPSVYNFPSPYQFQITYQAGLPTGTANLPPVLEALTILAQIDLNEKDPGNAGMNEASGDLAVTRFRSLDYSEGRGLHSLIRTGVGESAKAMRVKRLLDITIRKARRTLMI